MMPRTDMKTVAVFTRSSKSSNENEMSDGGRERVSLEVRVWKSSQSRAYGDPPFAPSLG